MGSGRFRVSSGSTALWSGVRLAALSISDRDHDNQKCPPHSLIPHYCSPTRAPASGLGLHCPCPCQRRGLTRATTCFTGHHTSLLQHYSGTARLAKKRVASMTFTGASRHDGYATCRLCPPNAGPTQICGHHKHLMESSSFTFDQPADLYQVLPGTLYRSGWKVCSGDWAPEWLAGTLVDDRFTHLPCFQPIKKLHFLFCFSSFYQHVAFLLALHLNNQGTLEPSRTDIHTHYHCMLASFLLRSFTFCFSLTLDFSSDSVKQLERCTLGNKLSAASAARFGMIPTALSPLIAAGLWP